MILDFGSWLRLHKRIFIQVSEFFSLFFATLFAIPLPSRFKSFRLLANLRVAASYSMHLSLILLPLKFRVSIVDSQMAFARCKTPVSVILLLLRSSSNNVLLSFRFFMISFTC